MPIMFNLQLFVSLTNIKNMSSPLFKMDIKHHKRPLFCFVHMWLWPAVSSPLDHL